MLGKKRSAHYKFLKRKWTEKHRKLQKKIYTKHRELVRWTQKNPTQLAIGSVGGLLLLTAPVTLPALPPPKEVQAEYMDLDDSVMAIPQLVRALPGEVRPLTREEEENTAAIVSRTFGITVTPELEGKRLNRSYGYIGAEQHLYRYPGDNLSLHADNPDDWRLFGRAGIAPHLGAFGYFAPSAEKFGEKEKLREKYYIAVQTFLIPDYNQRVSEYRDFFRFRKMIVVNPHNGRAIVVVVGDAGPAEWTGKSLGGSPEVMYHLERKDGRSKGPVLYFFVDDPEDKVPLGPITVH